MRLSACMIVLLVLAIGASLAQAKMQGRWVVQCKPAKCDALARTLLQRGLLIKESGKGFLVVVKDPRNARWAKETAVTLAGTFGDLTNLGELAAHALKEVGCACAALRVSRGHIWQPCQLTRTQTRS